MSTTKTVPSSRSRQSVKVYVIATIALLVVPALILSAVLATSAVRSERAQLEQDARNQTRETTAVMERDIAAIQNVLAALAVSPSLQTDDFSGFYDQAKDVSRALGLDVALRDLVRGGQVVNTAVPFGTDLVLAVPVPYTEADEARLRSGSPVVTKVFFGPLIKQYLVAVMVPIFRGKDLRYYLSAGVPLQRFADLLATLDTRPDEIISVVDREGTFVARNIDQGNFVGTKGPYRVPPEPQSVLTGINRAGIPFHWFNRQSDLLGWSITTGLPDSMLEAPLRRALLVSAAADGLLLLIAAAVAFRWIRRISQSYGALGIDRKPTREEFEILFDSSPNGVIVVDDRGRIVLLNQQMGRLCGYAPEELVGRSVDMLVPQRIRTQHDGLRRAFSARPNARPMGGGRELFCVRKDGSEFSVEVGLSPIAESGERLVMATLVDISARKLADQRLADTTVERDDLRRRFIQAQEQERVRLARELHDQTGQSLAAVMLDLKNIENASKETERPRFRDLRRRLEHVGQTLHHVAWELRPASIDELGLENAVANYIAEWSRQYGIEVDFHRSGATLDGISDEISTTLYRVVQEALTNVIKHAGSATAVSIVVERTSERLCLTIEDNGRGFDVVESSVQATIRQGGLGLAGMRERLTLIGAELEIESSIGVGTTIFARIPLQQVRAA